MSLIFSKHYDLFAGIGGFSLGVLAENHFFCEIDKNCQQVLKACFGDSEIHGDVTTLNLPLDKNSIITGGFPCQPFSVAGSGIRLNGGFVNDADPRSKLFFETARIISQVQPKVLILENVPGILKIKNNEGKIMGDVVKHALEDLGYDVSVDVISPTDVGVPHVRNRVFFVGIRKDSGIFLEKFVSKKGSYSSCVEDILDHEDKISPSLYISVKWGNLFLKLNPSVLRETALKENMLSRPPPKFKQGCATVLAEVVDDTPSGISRQGERLYSIKGSSPTLICTAKAFFDTSPEWRQLSVVECLRLQSFPDTHPVSTKGMIAHKQIGNSVNVDVVKSIVSRLHEN